MTKVGRVITSTVQLDIERTLRFDFNALAELEELGIDLLGGSEKRLGPKLIRALVFAGLASQEMFEQGRAYREPSLSLPEVGGLVGEHQEAAGKAVAELFTAFLPETEDVEEMAEATGAAEGKAEAASAS